MGIYWGHGIITGGCFWAPGPPLYAFLGNIRDYSQLIWGLWAFIGGGGGIIIGGGSLGPPTPVSE